MSLSRKNRLEVTSPAIVGLNSFLDSSHLFWRDALTNWYLEVRLPAIFRTHYRDLDYIFVNLVNFWLSYAILLPLQVIWLQLHMLVTYIKLLFYQIIVIVS